MCVVKILIFLMKTVDLITDGVQRYVEGSKSSYSQNIGNLNSENFEILMKNVDLVTDDVQRYVEGSKSSYSQNIGNLNSENFEILMKNVDLVTDDVQRYVEGSKSSYSQNIGIFIFPQYHKALSDKRNSLANLNKEGLRGNAMCYGALW